MLLTIRLPLKLLMYSDFHYLFSIFNNKIMSYVSKIHIPCCNVIKWVHKGRLVAGGGRRRRQPPWLSVILLLSPHNTSIQWHTREQKTLSVTWWMIGTHLAGNVISTNSGSLHSRLKRAPRRKTLHHSPSTHPRSAAGKHGRRFVLFQSLCLYFLFQEVVRWLGRKWRRSEVVFR